MTENHHILVDVRQEQGTVFLALSNGEVFELAPGSLPRNLPEIGESISSPLLAEIRLATERKNVARRIFAMLDRRLFPEAILRDKLVDKGFSLEAIDAVLKQMTEQGIYSDRHYAEAYCRDCLRGKAVGRRYLEKKLWEKRVARDLTKTVPAEMLDTETEKELAQVAARTRWKREIGKDRRKSEAKVTRYLLGRGFPVGVAARAVRMAADEAEKDSSHFEGEG